MVCKDKYKYEDIGYSKANRKRMELARAAKVSFN